MSEIKFSDQQLKDAVVQVLSSMNVRRHDMDMDMGGMGSDSDSSSSMSMNMSFTTKYLNTPVLFSELYATSKAQAFGIFVLFFAVAFLTKGLEFTKNYLEQKVWNNPNYVIAQKTTIIEQCECDGETAKVYSPEDEPARASGQNPPRLLTVLSRDVLRVVLCFIIELFSYALMLVAMSFSLVYFFAVVAGMAIGRFFFERVGDKIRLRPGQNNYQTRD